MASNMNKRNALSDGNQSVLYKIKSYITMTRLDSAFLRDCLFFFTSSWLSISNEFMIRICLQNKIKYAMSRKGSVSSNNNSIANSIANSKERNEAWTCDTVFQSDQSKLLECEYCKTHRCIKCLNMPAACYKGLSGREDCPWLCNNCLSKTLNCIREVKSIQWGEMQWVHEQIWRTSE